jgi:hypothetical protein
MFIISPDNYLHFLSFILYISEMSDIIYTRNILKSLKEENDRKINENNLQRIVNQPALIVQLVHLQTIDLPPGDWDSIKTCVANFRLKPASWLSSPTIDHCGSGSWYRHTFTVRTLLRIGNALPSDLIGFECKDEYEDFLNTVKCKRKVEGFDWAICTLCHLHLIFI